MHSKLRFFIGKLVCSLGRLSKYVVFIFMNHMRGYVSEPTHAYLNWVRIEEQDNQSDEYVQRNTTFCNGFQRDFDMTINIRKY